MPILRVKMLWSGFTGAPGYSVFHFNNFDTGGQAAAQNASNAVHAFFNSFSTLFPVAMSLRPESAVELIDETTGNIMDILTTTPAGTIQGAYTQGYSSVSGALVHWETAGIRRGRRVRGKTFLVPMGNAIYQSDGTIATAHLATIQTAAQALVDDANTALCVWGRPSPNSADGENYVVTGARVPDKSVVLRSRRD
jgi:hypothetical protein